MALNWSDTVKDGAVDFTTKPGTHDNCNVSVFLMFSAKLVDIAGPTLSPDHEDMHKNERKERRSGVLSPTCFQP